MYASNREEQPLTEGGGDDGNNNGGSNGWNRGGGGWWREDDPYWMMRDWGDHPMRWWTLGAAALFACAYVCACLSCHALSLSLSFLSHPLQPPHSPSCSERPSSIIRSPSAFACLFLIVCSLHLFTHLTFLRAVGGLLMYAWHGSVESLSFSTLSQH